MNKNERGAAEIALAVIGGILALALLVGGVFAIRWVMAPANGALEQREKTIGNGNYRIAQYDHFFNLCGSIQASEDKIKNTEETEPNDGMSENQKAAILLALKNTRASLIREYNADASKADTAAHFKSSSLPYQIDVNGETTCA